jgi:twitching motility protein PilT
MNFEQLLKFGVDQGAAGIHLQADSPPQLRIGGLIRGVEGASVKADELRAFIESIAPKRAADDIDRLLNQGAVFSTSLAAGRFRCTTFSQIAGPGLVLRVIPPKIRNIDELSLPRVVRDIALASRGIILVAGPSGSGKTTTLAAMVDLINASSNQKVVTIESPVEYLHVNKKAMITQMEVGQNASSFEHGLGLALKQDADVIVVGELFEAPAARIALAAAESGRKVIAATTGLSAVGAISHFTSLIAQTEKENTLARVTGALEAVIIQQLAKTREGKFRAAVEIFRTSATTTRSILEGRIHDLPLYMESRQGGMQTLDQHLLELHQSGLISGTETMRLANNPESVGVGLRAARLASAAASATGSIAPDAVSTGSTPPAVSPLRSEPGLAP